MGARGAPSASFASSSSLQFLGHADHELLKLWDAAACPGGPNINAAPIWDSQATCCMTTSPELRWKAHFFLAENRHPPKIVLFCGFITTRQTAMPIRIASKFCAWGCGRFQKLLYQCQNPSRSGIIGDGPESRSDNVRHGNIGA